MKTTNGNLVQLRKLDSKSYDLFHKWFSDKEVVKYSLSMWQKKHSLKQVQQWLEKTLKDQQVINFGILECSTNKLIGYAGLSNISKSSKSAEYFILIGDQNAWGKGYGTEVTK